MGLLIMQNVLYNLKDFYEAEVSGDCFTVSLRVLQALLKVFEYQKRPASLLNTPGQVLNQPPYLNMRKCRVLLRRAEQQA
jgi:hypothetical protein